MTTKTLFGSWSVKDRERESFVNFSELNHSAFVQLLSPLTRVVQTLSDHLPFIEHAVCLRVKLVTPATAATPEDESKSAGEDFIPFLCSDLSCYARKETAE